MYKFKRKKAFLSLMLVMTLLLTACGGKSGGGAGTDSDGAKTGGELVVAQGADPKSLDPHASNDQPSSRISKQIYDRLVEATEELEIVPGLAESWEQEDELTWRFKIREGVKFHNGEELTPKDVKFSLDRMKDSGEVGHIIGAVESIEIDGQDIIIKTAEPYAPLLPHLSHTAASILNEKAVTDAGEDYHDEPVGTGPFKFVENVPGDHVSLEKFDDYYGDAAKVDKLVFRSITEGTNREIGLETKEIDIAYDIEPVDLDAVRDNDDLELIEDDSLSTSYIGFNTKKKPFDDIKVRQAINYAINVQEIIDVVLEGAGSPANGPINDKVFGYDKGLKAYDYDIDKAKALLKEAGYEDGFKTSIWTNDNPTRNRIAEIVQEQLRQVGIDVAIEMVEWGKYLEDTAAGKHDMFILGWVTVTADADYGLFPLFHSSQHGGAGNRTFYENPEVNKLLEEGRANADPEVRKEAYSKAQQIIVEEAPEIFLYFQTQNVGKQKSVKGFKLHPAGHHRLAGVSKE